MSRIVSAVLVILVTSLGFHAKANAEANVGVVFSKDEISIITSWYRDHGPTGKQQKRGKHARGLPPGIARNLARGKPLPPGIAKQHLPGDLAHLLPAPPHGYERVIVDGRVLLVDVATHVIHDILTDIVFR